MMDYAVALHFDPAAEARIAATIEQLAACGIVNPTYRDTGMRPHLTLAELNTPHEDSLHEVLHHFTKVWPPFSIRLASIGVFPVEPAVLFYAPIVDDVLIAFHRSLNNALKRFCTDFSELYQDRNWVAHCTLALNLSTAEVQRGLAYLSPGFEIVEARFAGLDLYGCCPFRCLKTYPLPIA